MFQEFIKENLIPYERTNDDYVKLMIPPCGKGYPSYELTFIMKIIDDNTVELFNVKFEEFLGYNYDSAQSSEKETALYDYKFCRFVKNVYLHDSYRSGKFSGFLSEKIELFE